MRNHGGTETQRMFLSCVFFVSWCLGGFLFAQNVQEGIEKSKVVVEAFDQKGQFLRSGLGFVWDEATVVSSYATVKGASIIRVHVGGMKSHTNRLLSYSVLFDLAVLKAEEEMPEAAPLGSSDMLGAGDTVYLFLRQNGEWQLVEGTVKGWSDSGKGYEWIRFQARGLSGRMEPSPLYNASGKVVGWVRPGSTAIPLEAIGGFVSERTTSVSLAEVESGKMFWTLKEVKGSDGAVHELELPVMKTVYGTIQFPFQVSFPKHWQYERLELADGFLLRAFDDQFGICVEMRVIPQKTDDLTVAIQRAETLIFPGISRSTLVPYSADHFTGFRATYEALDPESADSISIFYAMSQKYFYALSVIYPQKYEEELKPLIEQIVSSLQL